MLYVVLLFIKLRIPDFTRIDAAKQLFNTFATRTQAYKLHHALGLTLFCTQITVKLSITQNVEDFEVFILMSQHFYKIADKPT